MENHPSFDLKEALIRWRMRLAKDPTIIPEKAVEAERDLLAAVHSFQARGLGVEEAFLLARSKRDGTMNQIEHPVGPVGPAVWPRRLLWMLAGLLGIQLITMASGTAAEVVRVAGRWSGGPWSDLASVSVISLTQIALALGGVFLCQRSSAATRVETWIARSGIHRKPARWCAAFVVAVVGLRYLGQWCAYRLPGPRLVVLPDETQKMYDRLRPFFTAQRFEAPVLILGILLYILWLRRRANIAAKSKALAEVLSGSVSTLGNDPAIAESIEKWGRCLAAHPGVSEEQAKEAAGHYYDSAEKLVRAGFTSNEALWLAGRRMGAVSEVASQLRSENPLLVWREIILWVCIGLGLLWTLQLATMFPAILRPATPSFWRGVNIPWLVHICLVALLLWSAFGYALRKRLKPVWRPEFRVRIVRGAALLFIAAMIFLSIPKVADHAVIAAMNMSQNLHQGTTDGLDQTLNQIGALIPSPEAGLAGLLVWFFLGMQMENVVIASTIYLLLRPAAGPTAEESAELEFET